jgi:choice-of-anchor B domain-containing protein
MVDIRDPKNPTFAGCYTDTEGLIWPGRTHDGQCVIYDGPDGDYQGHQICFASNETALRIVDVTEKQSPVPLAAASYPGIAYAHQGWLTDDKRYFYLDDELDELVGLADRTRTLIWDVADLEDPVLVGDYFGPDGATDHNLYVKGDRMYQANYQAGFRVVDISDPERPVEIGFFDTTPYEGNPPGFNGAWTAYPYFESGTVVVTSMYEGLFLLRPGRPELVP